MDNNNIDLELPKSFIENADTKVVELVFSQTEKMLQSTVKIADNITDRAYRIITALLPMIGLVMIGIFQKNNLIWYSCFFAILFLTTSLLFAGMVIKSHFLNQVGSTPDFLINKDVFSKYDSEKMGYEGYQIWLIKRIHLDINENRQINKNRIKFCNYAILSAFATILSPLLAIILLNLIVFITS